MLKKSMFVLLLQLMGSNSFAACENFLNGFSVDSYYYGNNPSEVTYYNISSEHLGLKSTIAAYEKDCTGPDCRNTMDTLRTAAGNRQLIKMGVSSEICNNLDQYTIMINGGGSCNLIPVQKITSINFDLNYPF